MSAGLLILRGDGSWAQDTKPGGARPPPDPEEELKYMAQEVRFYVEAVLGHLSGNIPKVKGVWGRRVRGSGFGWWDVGGFDPPYPFGLLDCLFLVSVLFLS